VIRRPTRALALLLILLGASAPAADPAGPIDLLAEAGPGLKGWTRLPIHANDKLNPESQWAIDPATGYLVCAGDKGHDWLRWDRELADFEFRVDWRFTPVEGKANYNSGIYVRNSADASTWHQAQTGSGSGGYLFGQTPVDGKLARINFSKQTPPGLVRPAGEWNTFEFTCKGPDITLRVNGKVANEWHDCRVSKGYVGLEAEGYRIEFRDVKVKPL